MMFLTHIAAGFLVALLGLSTFYPHNQILFLLMVLFGAALPDIDHPKSKLGRKVKVIAFLFEHRGFFHTLFALALFAFLVELLFRQRILTYAISLGYGSHLLTDLITKEGIMPFHPLSKQRLRGFLRTGGSIEYLMLQYLRTALGLLTLPTCWKRVWQPQAPEWPW